MFVPSFDLWKIARALDSLLRVGVGGQVRHRVKSTKEYNDSLVLVLRGITKAKCLCPTICSFSGRDYWIGLSAVAKSVSANVDIHGPRISQDDRVSIPRCTPANPRNAGGSSCGFDSRRMNFPSFLTCCSSLLRAFCLPGEVSPRKL